MSTPSHDHPLFELYRAWRDADETDKSTLATYSRETSGIRHYGSSGRKMNLPETVSSNDRTMYATIRNIRRKQLDEGTADFITRHGGDAVAIESELKQQYDSTYPPDKRRGT